MNYNSSPTVLKTNLEFRTLYVFIFIRSYEVSFWFHLQMAEIALKEFLQQSSM